MKELTEERTKRVSKIFFAWNDDKEEKWLESMAAEGWRLESAAPYVYYFRKSTPEKVVIRLDYKLTTEKDYQEYLTLFRDTGWELVVTFANWHYFRFHAQAGETPEIYNTDRAKAQKYRRLLLTFIPFFPIYFILLSRVFNHADFSGGSWVEVIYAVTQILMFILMLIWIYVILKIIGKIKKLESQSKE